MGLTRRRVTPDGIERYCRRCDEWWPDERGFWYRHGTRGQQCKACQDEWNRKWLERLSIEERRAYWVERAHLVDIEVRRARWRVQNDRRRRRRLAAA